MVFLALNSFISLSVTLCFASLGFELMFQLSSYPVLREPQVHLVQQFGRVDLLYWRFVLNVHMSRTLNASYLAELREHPKCFIQLETYDLSQYESTYVNYHRRKSRTTDQSKDGWDINIRNIKNTRSKEEQVRWGHTETSRTYMHTRALDTMKHSKKQEMTSSYLQTGVVMMSMQLDQVKGSSSD